MKKPLVRDSTLRELDRIAEFHERQAEERRRYVAPEPPPVATEGRPIWDLVIADMRARDADGRRKYGTPLQAGNGRDSLVDAYQEALDLAVYLRQAIEERDLISGGGK